MECTQIIPIKEAIIPATTGQAAPILLTIESTIPPNNAPLVSPTRLNAALITEVISRLRNATTTSIPPQNTVAQRLPKPGGFIFLFFNQAKVHRRDRGQRTQRRTDRRHRRRKDADKQQPLDADRGLRQHEDRKHVVRLFFYRSNFPESQSGWARAGNVPTATRPPIGTTASSARC